MLVPQFPVVDFPHLRETRLPLVQHVRLSHPRGNEITNIRDRVFRELGKSKRLKNLKKGASIGLTVGSRGIAHMVEVIESSIAWCKEMGYSPFIIPAMGSHGGADAKEQAQIIRSLGITEEKVGAPIKATMEVVDFGQTDTGVPCKFDKIAASADAVIIINRVKSHTSFPRPIESGLNKMIAVGLGKAEGARNVHKLGPKGLLEELPKLAQIAIKKGPIKYGLALVENAQKNLIVIEGVEPENFYEADERLLNVAKAHLAKLPFEQIDALVVEKIGKDISGMGMDYAVTGRTDIRGIPNPPVPLINKIGVLELTDESHGNAQGIGVADFIPNSLVQKIDLKASYMNSISAGVVEKIRIPPVLKDEEAVVRATVATCWCLNEAEARLCIIESTLHLTNILVSPTLLVDIEGREDIEVLSDPQEILFKEGNLMTKCSNLFEFDK